MGAIARESSRGWMTFSVLWGLNVGYSLAALWYQCATFSAHPRFSSITIAIVLLFNLALIAGLRRTRSRVEIRLTGIGETASACCCDDRSGKCH